MIRPAAAAEARRHTYGRHHRRLGQLSGAHPALRWALAALVHRRVWPDGRGRRVSGAHRPERTGGSVTVPFLRVRGVR